MFDVIKISDEWVAIHKYPGIDCHKNGSDKSLIQALRTKLSMPDLHQVHRLDKDTSGLMLFARGPAAAKMLSAKFAAGEIEKYYVALGGHKPRKKQGKIAGDMEKSRRGAWKLTRTHHNPAVTSFFSLSVRPGQRLYLLKPYTGRTHQLRVMMKSIGAPVLGDRLYGLAEEAKTQDRMYLHAYALRFTWKVEGVELIHAPQSGMHFSEETLKIIDDEWFSPWSLPWPQVKGGRR